MNSKKIILLAGYVLCLSMAYAQSGAHAIFRAGDAVPEYAFTQFAGTSNKTIKSSESKNKLIILDLWTTFCSPCVEKIT